LHLWLVYDGSRRQAVTAAGGGGPICGRFDGEGVIALEGRTKGLSSSNVLQIDCCFDITVFRQFEHIIGLLIVFPFDLM
jgi:hypothetical protein